MKKNVINENYLDKIPVRNEKINFTSDENGIVTLEIENKGIFNKLAQKLLKKPKISYVHLDETGSFIWPLIDGEKSILALGEDVKERFKDKANPLYERLAKYFQILESYKFINFK
ncbi:MAG: PqqD family protein [Ruminococcaceae bacterium]|nr:PqqD family protein [Oscillospiraceae bacterium]